MAKTISAILAIKDNVTSKVKQMAGEVKKFGASFGNTNQKAKETAQKVDDIKSRLKQNTEEIKRVTKETRQFEEQLKKNQKETEKITSETKRLQALLKNSKELKKNSAEYKRIRNTIKENVARTKEVKAESKLINASLKSNKSRLKEMNTESSKLKSNLKNIRSFKNLDASAKKAIYSIKKFGTTCIKTIDNAINRAVKFSATLATAAGGMAVAVAGKGIKTGLSEAMDLEGYKLQLETATKDTKKASDIMQYAIDLANKTPFEGGQLVEGAAKFEAMGMSAKKWLTLTGDMAAATNKDFDQATEALIDAQTGELERLKEFGIKKQQIVDKANELFRDHEVVNAKGQIVDQEKFNEALIALMEERYTGGMEKQAKSMKGIMSTISGVMKSGLASIVGMNSDGTVKAGSLFDTIKQKAEIVAAKFQQWQNDGTFDKIGTKLNQGLVILTEKLKEFVAFVTTHKDSILEFGKAFIGFAVVFKVVGGFIKLVTVLKEGWAILKGLKAAAAIFGTVSGGAVAAVVLGVGALIAILVLAVKNWDKIKEAAVKCGTETMASINMMIAEFKKFGSDVIDWIANKIDGLVGKVGAFKQGLSTGISNFTKNFSSIGITGHATGTTYASGGLRMINERGSGEIVDLPNGSRVIPADQTRRMMQGNNAIDWVTSKIENLTRKFNAFKQESKIEINLAKDFLNIGIKGHATGTTYASGGLRMINERGSGEIVDLPNGSRVYPADQTRRMMQGNNAIDWVTSKIENLTRKFNAFKQESKIEINLAKDFLNIGIKGHATGTTYASGGLRMINERGSGEIVDLPNGSRVYPADQTRRMNQSSNVAVYVTVQGNIIGNQQYAYELGNVICGILMDKIEN